MKKWALIILFSITAISNGYSTGWLTEFVSIENVNEKHLSCHFNTQFLNDSFELNLDGKIFHCYQSNIYDTGYFEPRFIKFQRNDTVFYVFVDEIEKVSDDSIYTTIKIFERNLYGKFKNKKLQKNYGFPKNILKGIFITATKKERRKFWLLSFSITGLVLIITSIIAD